MTYEQQPLDRIERLRQEVESTARRLAPAITLYGKGEPHTLPLDLEEFSRVLDTRLAVEEAVSRRYRSGDRSLTSWTLEEGLYTQGHEWEIHQQDTAPPIGERPLSREELETAKHIDRLLEGRTDGTPVVALDFGAGLGLSWMRIAAMPKYSKAIEEGRLVMAATNLGSLPGADTQGHSGIARSMHDANIRAVATMDDEKTYPPHDIDWVQANQHRVQYLDANALELPEKSVSLPDGTSLPLGGKVDIIYEHFALRHSHVPDLALASFNELLGSKGTLYSDAAIYYHFPQSPSYPGITLENGETVQMTEEYLQQRRLALAVGSKMLQDQGFSYRQDDVRHLGIFTRT